MGQHLSKPSEDLAARDSFERHVDALLAILTPEMMRALIKTWALSQHQQGSATAASSLVSLPGSIVPSSHVTTPSGNPAPVPHILSDTNGQYDNTMGETRCKPSPEQWPGMMGVALKANPTFPNDQIELLTQDSRLMESWEDLLKQGTDAVLERLRRLCNQDFSKCRLPSSAAQVMLVLQGRVYTPSRPENATVKLASRPGGSGNSCCSHDDRQRSNSRRGRRGGRRHRHTREHGMGGSSAESWLAQKALRQVAQQSSVRISDVGCTSGATSSSSSTSGTAGCTPRGATGGPNGSGVLLAPAPAQPLPLFLHFGQTNLWAADVEGHDWGSSDTV